MRKKIVFFDIDGTLYDYRFGIPESTILAIKELRKNGHLAVISTGRTRIMVLGDILNLGFNGIIAGGGTYVEYNNNKLFEYVLPKLHIKELVESMRENNFVPIVEGNDNIYFDIEEITEEFGYIYEIFNREISNNILPIDFNNIRASKVSGRFTSHSDWERLSSRLNNKYTLVNHNNNLLEAIPIEYSKAEGIKLLLKHLNIDEAETYAFGDSFNDLEMLNYVDYGIAMGNANPELKSMVKHITTDIEKDGIYNGLKDFDLI